MKRPIGVVGTISRCLYVLSTVAAAGVWGFLAGTLGGIIELPVAERRIIAAIVLFAFALRDTKLVWWPMPEMNLLVPAYVVRGAPWRAAIIWGVVLGSGFVTYIRFGIFWGMMLATLILGSPLVGLLVGMTYGLSRAMPVIASSLAPRGLHCQADPNWFTRQSHRVTASGAATMCVVALVLLLA